MTRLNELYELCNQSPWLDNLRRDYLKNGHMAYLIEQGVRGVTSNPTIFAKSMESIDDYDEQFYSLIENAYKQDNVQADQLEDAYWAMAMKDVTDALDLFAPLYEASQGTDGFVSLEVSPFIANDTKSTIKAAKWLHEEINRPNLLTKVPATKEGIPAVQQLISQGHSVNVTLIFSHSRYEEVMEAYITGLEQLTSRLVDLGKDQTEIARSLGAVSSVASFFVSRIDTEVDKRLAHLEQMGKIDSSAMVELAGKAGLSQAKLAYKLFRHTFSTPRWQALAAIGAKVQRPLWASTSTKNPAYPDLLYVDNLIGDQTVNTIPDTTLDAFLDHGTPKPTIDTGRDAAENTLAKLHTVGIDMDNVTQVLEDEGVKSFTKSFEGLLETLNKKAQKKHGEEYRS
ncbi:MAG: transaldolase [Actinobacteria bacterium]|nr:transaldolase [Actinomycetota bacterium]MCL6105724.1 transaldolase [Actinomycetota bacterium]